MGAPSQPGYPLRYSPAELRAARRALIESGGRVDAPLHQLDPRLARSWVRSSRAGLLPEGRSSGSPHASAAQLARALELQRELVAHAAPVMEYLFEQTRDSGSMVILADAQGMLLHALGDPGFMDRAGRVALRPGAIWQEQLRGTNAIGTTLADGHATVVRGAEHFLDRNGFLTCAAAPILDPGGRLLGVLDISGDHRSAHPHTLGLARAGARMIEQRLFDTRHHDALRLRFHRHAEGIATLTEGMLAVSRDGWILGANAVALEWLGLRPNQVNGVQLDAVFELDAQGWARWLQQGERAPRCLASHRHGPVWARVDAAAAALEGVAARVAAPTRDRAAAARPPASESTSEITSEATVQAAPRSLLPTPHAAAPRGAAQSRATPPAAADALAALDLGDPCLGRAIDRARRLRDPGIALLLQGESGVGKERFARAWHASGARRAQRFVVLRCAALPRGGLARALQGSEEMAGRRQGDGALALASGGTLFLDEVADLTPPDQCLLLQLLEAREAGPAPSEDSEHGQGGANVGEAKLDGIALVTSTRRRLLDEVAAGRFREDLYHRINGLLLQLPPLRERQDMAALTQQWLAELAPGRALQLEPAVAAALGRARWPGNLRQLANALRAAIHLLGDEGSVLGWAELPDDLIEELRATAGTPSPHPGAVAVEASKRPAGLATPPDSLDAVTAQAIHRVLAQVDGNVSEAARRLGISRNTLYRHLRAQTGDPGA